jgi:hypothetical protein
VVDSANSRGPKGWEVWRPLFGIIDERWRGRFGTNEIDHLHQSLWSVVKQLDIELPDCLPILGYGLFSRVSYADRAVPPERRDETPTSLPLPVLLSRRLLAFAIEFEAEANVSLAICANVIRVLDVDGLRIRDLPRLSGVSKEAISMAMGYRARCEWTAPSGAGPISGCRPGTQSLRRGGSPR